MPHVGSGARSTLPSVNAFPQPERPANGSSEDPAPGGASAGEGEVSLDRAQTLMRGAPSCTFRYKFAPR